MSSPPLLRADINQATIGEGVAGTPRREKRYESAALHASD